MKSTAASDDDFVEVMKKVVKDLREARGKRGRKIIAGTACTKV